MHRSAGNVQMHLVRNQVAVAGNSTAATEEKNLWSKCEIEPVPFNTKFALKMFNACELCMSR